MNRYLLSFVVGAIALFAFLSVDNGREVLRRAGDASRESISANPSSAAENANLTGIESAGENVLRQTSPEAIERLQVLNETTPTPSDPQLTDATPPAATDPTQRPTNATPPVPPSSVPPATPTPQPAPVPPTAEQEPIPALW